MQSTSLEKRPAISSDSFKQIYAVAKKSKVNKEAATKELAQLLKSACIDEIDNWEFSPAARLAAEGDTEAVLFLVKCGASVSRVAFGAAFGGDFPFAKYLHQFYGANIALIVWGAAFGGHREYAEQLRLKHKIAVNLIAHYAARGEHKDYVEDLRKLGASTDQIAAGAASGGHRDYAESFRNEKNAQPIANSAALIGDFDYVECLGQHIELNMSAIAYYAAYGGHRYYAEDLRSKYGADVNSIACGAAQGGQREYAEYLRLNFGADIDQIARWAACFGHIGYAEYLRLNCKVNVIALAKGAAERGRLEYLEHLYRECKLEAKSILNEASNCIPSILKLALQALSKNDEFRVEYDKASKQTQVSNPEIRKLIQKAQKVSALKDKYNFDQCFALDQPEICVWYLECFVLVKQRKMTFNLFASIGTYLSPLTYQESKGLCTTLRFDMFQKLLVKDLNSYCASRRWFNFFNRDENAEVFAQVFSEVKESKKLKGLLEQEAKAVLQDEKSQQQNKANPYKDLIFKHCKRLS